MSIRFSRLALVAVVTTMMGVGTRAAQAETREQRPGPPPGPQFDKAGALEVLKAIPLQSCKTATSPKGRSALTVTFESSGAVQSVTFMKGSQYDATPSGTCIVHKLQAAKVAPFVGAAASVEMSFALL